jgi:hypothetical protein
MNWRCCAITAVIDSMLENPELDLAAITHFAFLQQSLAMQAASAMHAYRAWETGEHSLETMAIKTPAGGHSRGWYLVRGFCDVIRGS